MKSKCNGCTNRNIGPMMSSSLVTSGPVNPSGRGGEFFSPRPYRGEGGRRPGEGAVLVPEGRVRVGSPILGGFPPLLSHAIL